MSQPGQAYYNGDFWEPMVPVTAGETPAEPKWRPLRVPDALKAPVVYLAAAHVFNGEGMADQARLYENLGQRLLLDLARVFESQEVMPVPFRVGV
jgi:hypothetical protein